ncbi:MAG: methylmalonyl-CoA carboxyltransferase [Gammaproteobacteria bacterium]|nr:methylmalonyl-CoA carboxyltransferase [Gammaproteobacteria bacterium]
MGSWEEIVEAHREREAHARSMGGAEKLARRAASGVLNARQRIDGLFDAGSFHEIGLFATSFRTEDRDSTPADGKIAGFGRIRGRKAGVVANDLTVKGASSSVTNGRKIAYMKQATSRNGMPLVFLGESAGARMPDTMGAAGMGTMGHDPTQYMRVRDNPWASAILGPCYGSSVWYACLSDYVVMRKGAVMAVSSDRVTSMAISQAVDPEELGGWRLQTQVTGQVDLAVDTDEQAIEAIQRFLSYLPQHHGEPPPRAEVPAGSDTAAERLLDLVPQERSQVYDMRKVIDAIADRDSVLPLKDRFGRAAVTALARLNGETVGFIASNPMMKGGALDPDACDKVTSFLVLCDSFNIPVITLVDTPGFLIGVAGERQKAPGKIMNYMQALQMCSVPRVSVILRKSYGQAYLNMGGGRNSDAVGAWFTADVSFMDPAIGVRVVHGVDAHADPARYAALAERMQVDNSAYELGAVFAAQSVIDPRETRRYLIDTLDYQRRDLHGGVGAHLLRGWPCTF